MFSCALPPCSPTRKQSKIARERERKRSLQKGKDRYNIVKGLAEGVDGISFESLLKRRHYLRARNSYLILEPFDDAEDYSKFWVRLGRPGLLCQHDAINKQSGTFYCHKSIR